MPAVSAGAKLSRAGRGRHCWRPRRVNSERSEAQVHERPALIRAVPTNTYIWPRHGAVEFAGASAARPAARIMTSRCDNPNPHALGTRTAQSHTRL
ncbi:unnamed protein product, partial [Iphiclides podalirius]